jgi:hypothetical protein
VLKFEGTAQYTEQGSESQNLNIQTLCTAKNFILSSQEEFSAMLDLHQHHAAPA